MKAPASEGELTFATPNDSGFPFVLFVCVLGSLLLHAATFFLFHVVYPQRVTIPPPPPQVSLLTPSSPENVALLRWIEAEDPALVANENPITPQGLVEAHYSPSFLTERTTPLGAPEEKTRAVHFPRATERLAPTTAPTGVAESPVADPVRQTSLRFSGALASRAPAQPSPLSFRYRASDPAKPATLLVGVNAEGQVRFSVVEESSGDPALDDMAIAQLQHLAFAPAAAPVAWGFATFSWGSDAYAPSAKTP